MMMTLFCIDQHADSDFDISISLKQQYTGVRVIPLVCITCIPTLCQSALPNVIVYHIRTTDQIDDLSQ